MSATLIRERASIRTFLFIVTFNLEPAVANEDWLTLNIQHFTNPVDVASLNAHFHIFDAQRQVGVWKANNQSCWYTTQMRASNWTIKVSNCFRESFRHSFARVCFRMLCIGSMWTFDFTIIAFLGDAHGTESSHFVDRKTLNSNLKARSIPSTTIFHHKRKTRTQSCNSQTM